MIWNGILQELPKAANWAIRDSAFAASDSSYRGPALCQGKSCYRLQLGSIISRFRQIEFKGLEFKQFFLVFVHFHALRRFSVIWSHSLTMSFTLKCQREQTKTPR